MPTYRTQVGANGQIALPKDLVDRLGIHEGAEVEFFLTLDGDIFFHAITGTAKGWKDLFPTNIRTPPLSIREMDEGMVEGLVEDDERIRREGAQPIVPGKDRSAAE